MKIKDISPENRPIERLINIGSNSLSNAELLAIILKTGTKENNVLNLANTILSKYNLDELHNITINQLQEIKGIGSIKAAQIKSIIELSNRITNFKYNNINKIYSVDDVYNFIKKDIENKIQEHLVVIALNNKNEVLAKETLTIGTNNQTLISSKDICYFAIKQRANAIIIAHNHPSGECYPSNEDKVATNQLRKALEYIEIEFVDHLIITKNNYFSFREKLLIT